MPPDLIKFLLVDDIEANLLALEGLLKRPGLELLKARSGAEALELLLAHEIALAILDVQMPEMDGFELARLMRGTDRTRPVPIVFLTAGTADAQRRFEGYEAGAIDFLFKPVEPHILQNKANIFFEMAQQRQALRVSEKRSRETSLKLAQSVTELREARSAALNVMEEAVEARDAAERLNIALRESEERAEAARVSAEEARLRAETAARAKDEFLAALSHELRTPLNPALLLVSALADDAALPPQTRADIEVIERSIALQVELVDDLLDLTRITGGKLRLHLQPIDAHDTFRQALELVASEIQKRRVGVTLDLAATRHFIHADPVRMQQVFWNVLKNAVKFTPPEGDITVRTHVPADPADSLVVEVADTGIGIEPEMLEKIFDSFAQEDHGEGHRFGGLGLGLAITRRLVELQRGRIHARSEGRGRGATFQIEMPLAASVPGPPAPAAAPGPATPLPPVRRILLVEDHKMTRETLGRLLQRRGHTVFAAATATAARELAATGECDLVISDLGLPDCDGHTFMAQLRNEHGLPGIAMSGYGAEEDLQRSRESGFFTHLTKPVNLHVLEAAIAAAPPVCFPH